MKPDIRLTALINVRRRPPFLLSVAGDLTFRGTFSRKAATEISVVTLESDGPRLEPKISTDLPFIEIIADGVSDKPGDTRDAQTVGGPLIVRTRKYRVCLKEPPPDPTFIGTITVLDPFGRSPSQSLNVLGQLDRSDVPKVVPGSLTLRKRKGASGSFIVICDHPSRTVTCSLDERRSDAFFIKTERGDSSLRIQRIEVVIANPTHLTDGPVHLNVRYANSKDKTTVLLRLVP